MNLAAVRNSTSIRPFEDSLPGRESSPGATLGLSDLSTVAVERDSLALKRVRGSLPGCFALFTGFRSGRRPSDLRPIYTLSCGFRLICPMPYEPLNWPNPTRVGIYPDPQGSYLVKTDCMLQISNPARRCNDNWERRKEPYRCSADKYTGTHSMDEEK